MEQQVEMPLSEWIWWNSFFTNGQNQAIILHNGNVGIGTENAQNKLDVKGKIRTKKRN